MSDQRHRRTSRLLGAAGLAGFAGLAVLVGAPAAFAATSGPTVTFSGGGIGVLSCPSRPDTGRVSLTEGNWVHVVNNTGYDADLKIGVEKIDMPPGAGRSVALTPGTYTMRLEPSCLVNLSDAESVSVEVAAARSTPRPTTSTGGTGGTGGTPDTGAGPSTPRTTGGGTRSAAPRETGDGSEDSGDNDRPGVLGGSPAGTPPTGAATLDDLEAGAETVPPPGAEPMAPVGSEATGDVVAVTEFQPSGDLVGPRRASRLLALIATVCVLGVTIAAFRAIVLQRTKHTITA